MILSRLIFLHSILVNFIISQSFLPDRFALKIVLIKKKGGGGDDKKRKYFVSSLFLLCCIPPHPKISGEKKKKILSQLMLLPPFLAVLAYFLSHFFPLFYTDILF